jgi:predicted peroxiredoxin
MGKVAFVVNGSENSNIYPPFILGSAAAALGDEVVYFFTTGAASLLKPGVLEGIAGKGLSPISDLLSGLKSLGARMILCELALDAMDLTRGELRDDIEIAGATSFMAEIQDATNTFSF